MTTNYLDEADQLCDRLAIIDGGRIKAMGSPSELKAGLGGDMVSLTIGASDANRIDALSAALRALPMVRAVTAKPAGPIGLDIRVDSSEKALPAVLEAANRTSCRLELVDYHRPRLDDVFVANTGHAIREEFPQGEQD
jgi:ABC-2 type transport system ATP-binding protein